VAKVLSKRFFNKPVLKVAPALLGKYLVRRQGGKKRRYLITEVEAYDGEKDLACHASRGRTKRNAVMFGEAGHFYVYFVYGMHWMLNIVTGKKSYPAAVLIRGVKGINGPARLTGALRISRAMNGKPALPKTGLWFEKGIRVRTNCIKRTPRIGVGYAGVWAKKKWRFLIKGNVRGLVK